MLITVAADHERYSMVKLLHINENTGDIKIDFIDTTSQDDLVAAHELLEGGISFADFQVVAVADEEKKKTTRGYELRHACSNITEMKPNLELDQMVVREGPSFVGFIRRVIADGGKIVLPLNDVPEQDIPSWMTASANTVQISKEMKGYISYQYPSSNPGYWRWGSATLFELDKEEVFNDTSGIVFLTSNEFELGQYEQHVNELEPKSVFDSNSEFKTMYRAFTVSPNIPVFAKMSNLLMQSSIISQFKFIADSYKLALYQLTAGLFEERQVEYSDSPHTNVQRELGRHVYLQSTPQATKKVSNDMMDYLVKDLLGEDKIPLSVFKKNFPHYEAFNAIILSQTPYFQSEEISKSQKMRRYQKLKSIEAQFNILMNECLYHAMFDNNAFQFNYWGDTGSFKSDIPNYKINLGGGGGKWRLNPTFF